MEPHQIRVPSVSDYVAAFRAIETRITPNQREALRVYHKAPAE